MHWLLAQFLVRPPVPGGSYAGKTVVVTGSNQGLGKEAARHYARMGASRIILAVRDLDKGHDAKHDIEGGTKISSDVIQVWRLDMASYASVRAFSARVASELERVDVVLLNAGLAPAKPSIAEDNDVLFTVNTVSTILLAGLLLPALKATAAKFNIRPTICITGSVAHTFTKFPERSAPDGQIFTALNKRAVDEGSHGREDLYSISKLLLVMSVRAIAENSPADRSFYTLNIADPGLCWSGLARDFAGSIVFNIMMTFMARSTEVGSRCIVHGGAQGPDSHGSYLAGCRIEEPSAVITGPGGKELQDRVWKELCDKLDKIEPGVSKNFATGMG